jgi:hypothetical protein
MDNDNSEGFINFDCIDHQSTLLSLYFLKIMNIDSPIEISLKDWHALLAQVPPPRREAFVKQFFPVGQMPASLDDAPFFAACSPSPTSGQMLANILHFVADERPLDVAEDDPSSSEDSQSQSLPVSFNATQQLDQLARFAAQRQPPIQTALIESTLQDFTVPEGTSRLEPMSLMAESLVLYRDQLSLLAMTPLGDFAKNMSAGQRATAAAIEKDVLSQNKLFFYFATAFRLLRSLSELPPSEHQSTILLADAFYERACHAAKTCNLTAQHDRYATFMTADALSLIKSPQTSLSSSATFLAFIDNINKRLAVVDQSPALQGPLPEAP